MSSTRQRHSVTGSLRCGTGGCSTTGPRPSWSPGTPARRRFGSACRPDGVDATADSLQQLNGLPGVALVAHSNDQVAVRGTREVIAHVGGWLVASQRPIPPDLRVDIPDLEAALLILLDQPIDQTQTGVAP